MGDSAQNRKKNLQNMAIVTACIALVLVTFLIASDYVSREICSRDREISDLKNQVSKLQWCLADNGTQILSLNNVITNLTDCVDRLAHENEQLRNLPDAKQYQLKLAWHEIYVLRNQTARLESQITELKKQIEESQSSPLPNVFP